jgi:Helix-turn-helix domain of resolvase
MDASASSHLENLTTMRARPGNPDGWLGDLMTADAPPLGGLKARRPFPAQLGPKGSLVCKLMTTTDHKTFGIMYIIACFATFFMGRLMALYMRAELELGRERRAASRHSRRTRGLPATKPPGLSPERQEQLRRLAAIGEPVRELAAAFGIGRATAYRYPSQ